MILGIFYPDLEKLRETERENPKKRFRAVSRTNLFADDAATAADSDGT